MPKESKVPKKPEMLGPGMDMGAGEARFDYIKSNLFRVIHVDGAFGGNTPRGNLIQMAVWNERWPIPKQSVHKISKEGFLEGEIPEKAAVRNACVREVEAQLLMDISTATRIRDWLDDKIKNYDKMIKTEQQKAKKGTKKK